MSSQDSWIGELSALAASSPRIPELAPVEVGFEVGGRKMGLDLTQGRITDGSGAQCWVAGSQEALSDIARGGLTLQRAHLMGRVQLSGDPEGLLRFAFLLDAARARAGVQEAPFRGGGVE